MTGKRERFRFFAFKLSGIMIVVFLLQMVFGNFNFTELFVLNGLVFSHWQIWRFLTAIFLHGGIAHLIYNLFALVLFGSILEKLIGSKRFLTVFFVTGILANVVSINFYNSSLGASGAVFGVIGALIITRPLQAVWAFGLPMPVFIAGIVWAIGDVIGIFIPDGVGNIAHLSGMFYGLLFGILYRTQKMKRKKHRDNYELF